jgi:hypothetical protein
MTMFFLNVVFVIALFLADCINADAFVNFYFQFSILFIADILIFPHFRLIGVSHKIFLAFFSM